MVVTTLLNTGDLPGTLRSALFGFAYAENVLNTRITPGMLARSLAFVTYNYPNLLLPAALYGIMRGGRLHCGAGPGMLDRRTSAPAPFIGAGLPPLARWALLGGLLIHAAFVLRYDIKDQYTFFLPLYVMLAIHGGMGAALVLGWVHLGHKRKIAIAAWVCLLLTPVVYVATPAVARRIHLLDGFARRPYRDSYRYLFVPWSVAEHSAERMAVEAISLAGPQGLILSEDRMGAFALEYKKVRLGLDDLELQALPGQGSLVGRTRLTSMLQQAANAGRRVVLVPTDARALAPQQTIPGMSWSRRGDLWLLVPVSAPASSQAAGS